MDVNGIGSVGRSSPITPVRPAAGVDQAAQAAPTSPLSAPRDEVDISPLGKTLDDLSRAGGLRDERLAQIKAAIADGSYETPEKLERALDRFLEQLE